MSQLKHEIHPKNMFSSPVQISAWPTIYIQTIDVKITFIPQLKHEIHWMSFKIYVWSAWLKIKTKTLKWFHTYIQQLKHEMHQMSFQIWIAIETKIQRQKQRFKNFENISHLTQEYIKWHWTWMSPLSFDVAYISWKITLMRCQNLTEKTTNAHYTYSKKQIYSVDHMNKISFLLKQNLIIFWIFTGTSWNVQCNRCSSQWMSPRVSYKHVCTRQCLPHIGIILGIVSRKIAQALNATQILNSGKWPNGSDPPKNPDMILPC